MSTSPKNFTEFYLRVSGRIEQTDKSSWIQWKPNFDARHNLDFDNIEERNYTWSTVGFDEINFRAIKSYVQRWRGGRGVDSPDSSASGVVIQRAGSVPPRDVSGRLRYIADHTLQFYRAARFVEFVAGCRAVLVHDLDPRHWKRNETLTDSPLKIIFAVPAGGVSRFSFAQREKFSSVGELFTFVDYFSLYLERMC